VSNPEQNASVKALAFLPIAPAAFSSVSSETSKTRTAISVMSSLPPFMALILLFITVDIVTGEFRNLFPAWRQPAKAQISECGEYSARRG
jgi:hypothetical protein